MTKPNSGQKIKKQTNKQKSNKQLERRLVSSSIHKKARWYTLAWWRARQIQTNKQTNEKQHKAKQDNTKKKKKF